MPGRKRGHQPFQAGAHRLHDQAKAADVQGGGACGHDGLLGPDRGRRRAGQVEVVAGDADRIDVDHRERGWCVGRGVDGGQHPMAVEVLPHQPPETIVRQPPQEGRGQAEPGHGAHDVERSPAEPGIDVTGRVYDQVDQGLARDGYHARPRIMLSRRRPATSASVVAPALTPLPPPRVALRSDNTLGMTHAPALRRGHADVNNVRCAAKPTVSRSSRSRDAA